MLFAHKSGHVNLYRIAFADCITIHKETRLYHLSNCYQAVVYRRMSMLGDITFGVDWKTFICWYAGRAAYKGHTTRGGQSERVKCSCVRLTHIPLQC